MKISTGLTLAACLILAVIPDSTTPVRIVAGFVFVYISFVEGLKVRNEHWNRKKQKKYATKYSEERMKDRGWS